MGVKGHGSQRSACNDMPHVVAGNCLGKAGRQWMYAQGPDTAAANAVVVET